MAEIKIYRKGYMIFVGAVTDADLMLTLQSDGVAMIAELKNLTRGGGTKLVRLSKANYCIIQR